MSVSFIVTVQRISFLREIFQHFREPLYMSLQIQWTSNRSDLDRNMVLRYLRNGCCENVNRYNRCVLSNNYHLNDISWTSVCRIESTLILSGFTTVSCVLTMYSSSVNAAPWENRESRLLIQTSEILLYFTLKRLYNIVIC